MNILDFWQEQRNNNSSQIMVMEGLWRNKTEHRFRRTMYSWVTKRNKSVTSQIRYGMASLYTTTTRTTEWPRRVEQKISTSRPDMSNFRGKPCSQITGLSIFGAQNLFCVFRLPAPPMFQPWSILAGLKKYVVCVTKSSMFQLPGCLACSTCSQLSSLAFDDVHLLVRPHF